jgi:hypothetical protein
MMSVLFEKKMLVRWFLTQIGVVVGFFFENEGIIVVVFIL